RGRLRRGEVQAGAGTAGPGGRRGLARQGWRQLLRRAGERARRQRLALLHGERQAQYDQVRERAGPAQHVAHAARGVRRHANQGRARRKDLDRGAGRPPLRRRNGRRVDQGRQRHCVRRLQLGEMSRAAVASWIVPGGVDAGAARVLVARALRGFGDGYVAVLLPAYLLALGLGELDIGIIGTVTLFGSAIATLALGAFGNRFAQRKLFAFAAFLMIVTGVGFAGLSSFWPLLMVAFFGTLNPSGGDVSVFLPLEHARLAAASSGAARTSLFARYSLAGSLARALGALAAALPDWVSSHAPLGRLDCMRAMFFGYALIGTTMLLLYRTAPAHSRQS